MKDIKIPLLFEIAACGGYFGANLKKWGTDTMTGCCERNATFEYELVASLP